LAKFAGPRDRARAPRVATISRRLLGAAAVAVALAAQPAAAATLKADYRFADTVGSSCCGAPTLAVVGSGTGGFATDTVFGAQRRVFAFPAGVGLQLTSPGVVPPDSYTIAVLFGFDTVKGPEIINPYERIVDFKNQTSDFGLYVARAQLSFYNAAAGASDPAPFRPNVYAQAILTRDSATKEVVGYVNGVEQFRVTDSTDIGVVSPDNVVRFFKDDVVPPFPGEESGGAVARIRLWDGPLSAAEVAAIDAPPPMPAPAPPPPQPAPPAARLTARVVDGRGRRIDRSGARGVAYGSRARLTGTLTTQAGSPIAGATLTVLQRVRARGRGLRQVGVAPTAADGAYSTPLRRGPSRDLLVSYRQAGGSASARAVLRVRAPVRLSVSRRALTEGGSLRLSGRLTGGPLPRAGKLVELQVRERGRWRTFATVRARPRRGRFSYRYRFPELGRTRTHRFRARAPGDDAYPYVTGASRAISVTVRRAR
jgi:hypothetical protein